ncbi:diaminopimelate decarboxylase [Parapedobacter defluvii]|uniref:diaminopimelate decarboxylase n=1 Tax=Parapedobacter defluvii TaxID=2045106 RepID=UPI003342196F
MFDANLIESFFIQETPFYYYDLTLLQKTLSTAKQAADVHGFQVHYALKANFNDRILNLIREAGFGADCVSGNEVRKAIEIGFNAGDVVFAGVGKSDKEISDALDYDIFAFNVESIEELKVINALAADRGKKARVALRINPNVDAQTHQYITTGLDENKFGIAYWQLGDAVEVLGQSEHLELIGIHFHIGSQIIDLNVFKSLCVKVNELNNWFDERGFRLRVLNVGGGLGVDYHQPDLHPIPDFRSYFSIFNDFLERKPGQEVHFELGRALVSQCGSLISRVLYVKNGLKKNFLILDAGMTELMRPALYQAYHQIEKLTAATESDEEQLRYDVVGPICESTDCFGKEVPLPKCERGDLIAIRTAGAYGEVMASRYNLRDEIRYVYSSVLTDVSN